MTAHSGSRNLASNSVESLSPGVLSAEAVCRVLEDPELCDIDGLLRIACRCLQVPFAAVRLFGEDRIWRYAPGGGVFPRVAADLDRLKPEALNPAGNCFSVCTPIGAPDKQSVGELWILDDPPRAELGSSHMEILRDLAAQIHSVLQLAAKFLAGQDIPQISHLTERILDIVVGADDMLAAMNAISAAIRGMTGAVMTVFLRLSDDRRMVELVEGQDCGPAIDAEALDMLRAINQSPAGQAFAAAIGADRQLVLASDFAEMASGRSDLWYSPLTPDIAAQFPGAELLINRGVAAQILTPVDLGGHVYCFALGLPQGTRRLAAIAAMMRKAAAAISPLYRRLADAGEREARNRQLRLMDAVVANLDDLVLITDAGQPGSDCAQIIYVNEMIRRLHGLEPEALVGRSTEFLAEMRSSDQGMEGTVDAFRAGRRFRSEYSQILPDGHEIWFDYRMFPICNSVGQITNWVVFQRDISDWKRAQFQLQANEERFRSIADVGADFIWDHDVNSGSTWISDRIFSRSMVVYPERSDDFRGFRRYVNPEDWDRLLNCINTVVTSGETDWTESIRITGPQGATIHGSVRGRVLRDPQGAPLRVIGAIADVTKLHELEERLLRSERLEALGQLTGGIAHDFNNLLTVILGNAELLLETFEWDEATRKMLEVMRNSAGRGAQLTSRLLAFARRQMLEPAVIDVNLLVFTMLELMRRTLGGQVDLVVNSAKDLWATLVDPAQLENAILNLCINGRDAMRLGGDLRIETANVAVKLADIPLGSAAKPGDYIRITVTDTGSGMSPAVLARAMEPFFTTKATGKGSGLGLSMVFGFVEQSNGFMTITSELGAGTSVALFFPRSFESPASPAEPQETLSAVDRKGGRILVVEDDRSVRHYVDAQLRSLGYQVVLASNAHEALDILEAGERFELVFSDIVMPGGLSGRELADEIRDHFPGLPVLLTSGFDSTGYWRKLDVKEFFLAKPYSRDRLREAIERVMATKPPETSRH